MRLTFKDTLNGDRIVEHDDVVVDHEAAIPSGSIRLYVRRKQAPEELVLQIGPTRQIYLLEGDTQHCPAKIIGTHATLI